MKAAHTGERPFKCEVCQASFIYPEHFKKHARIHTGEKPYLCEVRYKYFLLIISYIYINIFILRFVVRPSIVETTEMPIVLYTVTKSLMNV